MADLGTAYVNIVPKAPGISKEIEGMIGGDGGSGAENAGQSLGKRVLGGLTKLGIGAAIGSLLKQGFEAGGDLQQSFGGLDTIYGDASAAAKDYAMNAASAGISANEYAEQAVSMGAALKAAFGGDTNAAMEAANTAIMDMADNAAKMGTPIESIQSAYQGFAKGNYTMLDNLKLGYGGTKDEMERLLKDAQKISGVEYDISNLGDVYDAIHVIQGELGLTGVAAEESKTTLTGSMASVKASWTNLMAAMTTGEGIDTAMTNLGTSVGNFVTVAGNMFTTFAGQLPDLILGLVDIVIDNAPSWIAAGAELIIKLIAGLVGKIPDIAKKIPTIWEKFKEKWGAIDWKSLGSDLMNAIVDGVTALVTSIGDKASDIWDDVKTKWDNIDWKSLGTTVMDKIKTGITGAATKIWTALKNAIKTMKENFGKIDFSGLGSDIISGIVSGLTGGASSLYRKIKSIIKEGLKKGQEEAETGSPSRLFERELGRWIPLGIAEGIDDEAGAVELAVGDAVNNAARRMQVPGAVTPVSAPESRDTDRIIAALQRMQLVANVALEGDADQFLRVVNRKNWARTNTTGYNRLAAVGAR